jgi:hypothetical protein
MIVRVTVCLLFLLAGIVVGDQAARYQIAQAIRSGRLSIGQRIDSVANQIESGKYRPVGR